MRDDTDVLPAAGFREHGGWPGYPDFPETKEQRMEPVFDETPACPCGSGEHGEVEYDARGIYIGRMCDHCRTERLGHFRPEVLSDPGYDADEPIEPEE
jgi:hypothetical protein